MARAGDGGAGSHQFKLREQVDIAKDACSALEGWWAEKLQTTAAHGQMIQPVMRELMGFKSIAVLGEQANHCHRERVADPVEQDLRTDETEEAKQNTEAARLWIGRK